MKGVMLQGTASHVGKSILVTALCRMLTKQGFQISPFKAQNMSSHSVVLDTGGEIAVSQYEQAEAAGRNAEAWMNPVLLKPLENMRTEVFLTGKSQGIITGASFKDLYYQRALQAIKEGLAHAENSGDFVIIEGAGSPVEMNLKERDLANMGVAGLADVPVLLVADIERGGVFASIAGTLALLTEQERSRVKGILINKFSGNPSLFTDGIEWLESYTKLPVLGVIPYMPHQLDEEDSLYGTSFPFQPDSASKEADYEKLADNLEANINAKKLINIMEGVS
ncbi:cobyric acid synthase [Oceanobacillus sp. CFH 90083]|uniref:cobyric acid synthase n=1 Tax=Oceanobacillus sp. CFH 90083 TaxID=2592336 RepID=UPI00128D4BE7|nr:cobyric acid synthase [Oceanobacillus sp. CFH 90083]